ncbi:MAG: LuxR C-terminal-related transcriptional regulator [Bryobacteraceae bacterium]
MPLRILLAGPCRLTREGLAALLAREEGFAVAGVASSAPEMVQLCEQVRPDLVVIEVGSPAPRGLAEVHELGRRVPAVKRLALAGAAESRLIVDTIRSGVQACLTLGASTEEFLYALRVVADGGSYLSQEISEQVRRSLLAGEAAASSPEASLGRLTRREKQVLRLVAQGLSSREIAAQMKLSPETVRSYRKSMMRKLGVSGVAKLLPLAAAAGLIP